MIILVEPGNDSDDDRGFCVWRLMIDFYATMAQVLPLLLLALIWDSAFWIGFVSSGAYHAGWIQPECGSGPSRAFESTRS
jgi:hypothetical protein